MSFYCFNEGINIQEDMILGKNSYYYIVFSQSKRG